MVTYVIWPTALDPFNGEPLKMKVEGDSLIIWSVGANLTDHGGNEQKALDSVARYPRSYLDKHPRDHWAAGIYYWVAEITSVGAEPNRSRGSFRCSS
jgi:hypothetical protein